MPTTASPPGADPILAFPAGDGAFEDYRASVLHHMEQEQQALAALVERLRFARDRPEFDRFLAERRPNRG